MIPFCLFHGPLTDKRSVTLHPNEYCGTTFDGSATWDRLHACDLFVHFWAPGEPWMVQQVNQMSFKGKKCLVISDMHHGVSPITTAMKYATSHPWDMVLIQYNPNAVRWLRGAGVANVQYCPAWGINPIDIKPPEKRTRGITFVGGVNPKIHPYRVHVLDQLKKAGVDVEVISGVSREEAAKIHNESTFSLNISLNRDFNLRNFEVMAAGGCLVTDVPPIGITDPCCHGAKWWGNLTGLVQLLKENTDSVGHGQVAYDWYWNTYSPAKQIERFYSYLDNPEPAIDPRPGVLQQAIVFEQAQELARQGLWSPDLTWDIREWNYA